MKIALIGLTGLAAIALTLPTATAARPKPKPKAGCSIILYHDANFAGPDRRLVATFPDLKGVGEVYKQVSSFVVEKGTWTLFADEGFKNSVGTFPKGSRVAQAPSNNEIDSGMCKPS
ncbi:MAG: Beta/Gamma crystallin [Sphingomonadales bacterium]|jgi:hypothetical protein|nr:Beta/Gamma crystallin [Sphingomonadales bacterium]